MTQDNTVRQIRIAVPGVNGRMGSLIAQQVSQSQDLTLVLATVRPGNALLGTKVVNSNVSLVSELHADFDVLIDFTLPEAVLKHLDFCVRHKKPMVIGATGFSVEQLDILRAAAQEIPIVQGYNMSIGINACYKLLAQAAGLFGSNWDVEIYDLHHQHKKDAPSGTAKEMAKIIQQNSPQVAISFSSKRHGEVVGEHKVTFKTPEESVQIAHISHDRGIYAQGAIVAARWIYAKTPGLYNMQDVI